MRNAHSQKRLSFQLQVGHCLEKCFIQGSFQGNLLSAQKVSKLIVKVSSFPGGFQE